MGPGLCDRGVVSIKCGPGSLVLIGFGPSTIVHGRMELLMHWLTPNKMKRLESGNGSWVLIVLMRMVAGCRFWHHAVLTVPAFR